MALFGGYLLLLPLLLLLNLSFGQAGTFHGSETGGIKTIYNLGDSISDTGNHLIQGAVGPLGNIGRLPYGETIHKPTGRCSDGLLMIDFLAEHLGQPLLDPYLKRDGNFSHGVNFAVAGATALTPDELAKRGVMLRITNSSLDVQLDWFKQHLNSTCGSKQACANHLKESLILMGEIGGNDYNYAFVSRKTITQVIRDVPDIVQRIADAVKEVIDLGAHHIVVPGNFPIGCMPSYLAMFSNFNPSPYSYDKNGCLKSFNDFALLHNVVLQEALEELRKEYPHVKIYYADYYRAFKHLLQNAEEFGFESDSLLKACCGAGGNNNFGQAFCGSKGSTTCQDPSTHISWDGLHLTQQAYAIMAWQLIEGGYIHHTYGEPLIN